MAAWLDSNPDPTPLLAALAIGHIESRGNKSSELGGWGTRPAVTAHYRAWLATNTNHGKEATT